MFSACHKQRHVVDRGFTNMTVKFSGRRSASVVNFIAGVTSVLCALVGALTATQSIFSPRGEASWDAVIYSVCLLICAGFVSGMCTYLESHALKPAHRMLGAYMLGVCTAAYGFGMCASSLDKLATTKMHILRAIVALGPFTYALFLSYAIFVGEGVICHTIIPSIDSDNATLHSIVDE